MQLHQQASYLQFIVWVCSMSHDYPSVLIVFVIDFGCEHLPEYDVNTMGWIVAINAAGLFLC